MNRNPASIVVVQIIWLSLMFSCFLLVIALNVTLGGEFQFNFSGEFWRGLLSSPEHGTIIAQLMGMACVVLVISQVLPNRIYATLRAKLKQTETPTEQMRLQAMLVPFVLRCAMTEMVALFGFVISVAFARDSRAIVPFLMVAVLNYLRIFPANLDKMNRDLGGQE